MNISLNAVAFRNGKPFNTTLNLTKQSDGSWHATNFDKAMQGAYNASKNGAAQSRNFDTYAPETAIRTELSDQEIAELAGKYDPRNMTQDQYNKFLDDLIEKGALSRFDAMRLGHNGWRILDINPDSFATGGIGCGTADQRGRQRWWTDSVVGRCGRRPDPLVRKYAGARKAGNRLQGGQQPKSAGTGYPVRYYQADAGCLSQ